MRHEEGIFVGYAFNCNGYRILNPTTETVEICNKLCFDEKENYKYRIYIKRRKQNTETETV